jgi:hypothetical protein
MPRFPHTQGPWRRIAGRTIIDQHDNVIGVGRARQRLNAQSRIEDVNGQPHCIDPQTADRNLFLMSKTPELLAAVEELMNVGRTAIDARPECDWNRYASLLAEIRKDQEG